MPFILLAIIAVAAILVSGMSAIHGPVVVAGPAIIAPSGLPIAVWLLVIVVIGLGGWWLFRRRK